MGDVPRRGRSSRSGIPKTFKKRVEIPRIPMARSQKGRPPKSLIGQQFRPCDRGGLGVDPRFGKYDATAL
eukprot:707053-Amphidinium_carterae.1